MTEPSNHKISLSEDALRRILAEFKLDLFEELQKYATVVQTAAIDKRVQVLELEAERKVTRDEYHRVRGIADASLALATSQSQAITNLQREVRENTEWRIGVQSVGVNKKWQINLTIAMASIVSGVVGALILYFAHAG